MGLVSSPRVLLARHRERREADRRLRCDSFPDPRYAWRAAELTSEHERRLVARSLRAVLRELEPGRLPTAVPLNRVALRPYAAELRTLVDRLEALDRPISARGMLFLHDLLEQPESPFYDTGAARSLHQTLDTVALALGRG